MIMRRMVIIVIMAAPKAIEPKWRETTHQQQTVTVLMPGKWPPFWTIWPDESASCEKNQTAAERAKVV